jgi:hypothetical protein
MILCARPWAAIAFLCAFGTVSGLARADGLGVRPDGHAPIGVMGDHTHKAGEVMLSYRYMNMNMHGNRDGTGDVSAQQVLDDFPIAPTDMTLEMHMFGAMYAPIDEITLMVMSSQVEKTMDHLHRTAGHFTTDASGFGDTSIGGMTGLYNDGTHVLDVGLGVSLPTGSIDERGATPAGPDQKLPYPMQLGSGTFDILPGVTYRGFAEDISWGGQLKAVLRTGENDEDYTLGDQYEASAWGAYRWNRWVSTSVRLDGLTWGDIDGADPELNAAAVPTADPDLRAGTRLDLTFGINLFFPKGSVADGHRLAVEAGLPVYQHLDGPQLETDWIVTVGWQKAFSLY